jgi:hypothetical protein
MLIRKPVCRHKDSHFLKDEKEVVSSLRPNVEVDMSISVVLVVYVSSGSSNLIYRSSFECSRELYL